MSQVVRITISQDTGAPLVTEFQAVAQQRDGSYGWVSRRVGAERDGMSKWNCPARSRCWRAERSRSCFQQFREARRRARAAARHWPSAGRPNSDEQPWTLEILLETDVGQMTNAGAQLREFRSDENPGAHRASEVGTARGQWFSSTGRALGCSGIATACR